MGAARGALRLLWRPVRCTAPPGVRSGVVPVMRGPTRGLWLCRGVRSGSLLMCPRGSRAGEGTAVDPWFVLPIRAHWEGRAYPVRWPEHRPELAPGDVVRLDIDGSRLWHSFRVV